MAASSAICNASLGLLKLGAAIITAFVLVSSSRHCTDIVEAAPAPKNLPSFGLPDGRAYTSRNVVKRSAPMPNDHINNNNKLLPASSDAENRVDSIHDKLASSQSAVTRKSSEDLRHSMCSKVDEQIQELLMKYAEFTFKNCIQKRGMRLAASWIAPVSREDLCRKAEQEVEDVVTQHIEFLQTYCADVSITLNHETFL